MATAGFHNFSETATKDATARTEHGGLNPQEKWTDTVLHSIINEMQCNRSNGFNPVPETRFYSNPQVNDMLKNGLELFDGKSGDNILLASNQVSDNAGIRGNTLKQNVEVPGVGKVDCVDMKNSHEITQKADHELAGRDPHTYNCLFYLKTVIEGHAPASMDGSMEGMPSSQYMKDHGFSKAPHDHLKTGDVILISIPNPNGGVPTEHAGIVIGMTKNGEPIIRQKPDADHPPIDLTQSQFEACYCQGKTIEQQRAEHHAGVFRK